jgi:VCBS repeat-containing protein
MSAGDTMTFVINDASTGGGNPQVQVTITENADGSLSFHVAQLVDPNGGSALGDLRGFFFDLHDEDLIGSLSTSSESAAHGTLQQGNDSVVDLGNGSTMSGLTNADGVKTSKTAGAEQNGYDAGIEIGSAGIGKDDVRSFDFTLSSSSRALTLADFANVDFGVRITSVGTDLNGDGIIDTARDGSSKIAEHSFDPNFTAANDDAACVNEGAVGAVGNVLTNDDDATKTDLDLVKVSYNGTDYLFDANDATIDFVTVDLDGGGTVKIWQNGDYQVDATGVDVAAETFYDITYVVQKTVLEANGSVAGTSTESAHLNVEICPVTPPPGGGGEENGPPDAVDDSPACGVDGLVSVTGNVLGNDTDPDNDVLTVTAVNNTVIDFDDNGVEHIQLANGTLDIKADGSYTYTYTGGALPVGEEATDSFTYTISDGNGGEDTATVDLCIDAAAASHGYWSGGGHDFSDSEGIVGAFGSVAAFSAASFDDYFNIDAPTARTWTIDPQGPTPATTYTDLTFAQAIDFKGDNNLNPDVVSGADLVRESTAAILNLYDNESHDAFVTAYEYQRGIDFADDSALLADLKAEVEGAFEGTGDYSVVEMAALLHLTHE